MKQIQVTDKAAQSIEVLRDRNSEDFYFMKSQIADAQATISNLIEVGRDDCEVGFFTDSLLRVLGVMSDYVRLLNKLEPTEEPNMAEYGLFTRNQ